MAASDLPQGCIRHGVPFGQLCYRCNSAGTIPSAFGPFSAILPVPVDVPTGWVCPYCKRVYGPVVRQCVICSPPPESFTGPLPRPEPRRFPHPVGGLFPVHIEGMQCEPACEGGCSDPGDRLTLCLPPYMAAENANLIVRLGAGWNEVFPGLQCAIFLPTDDDGNVVAHFRLTPEDADEPADS